MPYKFFIKMYLFFIGITGLYILILHDYFALTPDPITVVAPTKMLVGGDITYRNLIMAHGGSWANDDGQSEDVLAILQDHVFNLARIRIYNKPGNWVNVGGRNYRLQTNYQDLADALKNARAAKAHGMSLFISLHYSDFWTNPSTQIKPKAWKDLNGQALEQALYDYTYQVMSAFKDADITPAYISIGNEINDAIAEVPRGEQYYKLLQKGYDAVKAVSKSTQVVIHLTNPDYNFYNTWIDEATTYQLQYDLLGTSMYPFWTNWSIKDMQRFINHIGTYAKKPIMICEVGYPWTLATQHGQYDIDTMISGNHLDPDGPENYGATPEGQLQYMQEYFRAMYNTGKVVGISYWDPIIIDIKGAGWVVGEYSGTEDTSFFDYNSPHKALKSLDAFYSY